MTPYHYTDHGLRGIYLRNGFTEHQTPAGSFILIDELHELHVAIMRAICRRPARLRADDAAFLRVKLGLSQRDLAGLVGTSTATVDHWEAGGGPARAHDLLIRLLCLERIDGAVRVADTLRGLSGDGYVARHDLLFEFGVGGWRHGVT